MSTDTQKYSEDLEKEPRHSAFQEFSRDERRPAVLMLGALVIAAIFFALGIMVGRWMTQTNSRPAPLTTPERQATPVNMATPVSTPTLSPTPVPSPSRQSLQSPRNR